MILREDLLTACPSSCLEKAAIYSAEKYLFCSSQKSQFLQVLEQVFAQKIDETDTHTKKILTELDDF